jgi:zinc transporter, ZIP family
MSTAQTVLLGAIAGFTIFLGLPVGRIQGASKTVRCLLNGVSAGILIFLLFEILAQGFEPVEGAFEESEWASAAGLGILYVAGFGIGLLALLYLARSSRVPRAPQSIGPGAMAVTETTGRSDALRIGTAIAVGIGFHNFAEGLAIGQAASADQISLAILLVIGFALHNATEGFGIVGPLAATGEQAPWGWLLAVGLIGGGPTFVGTLVGTAFTSEFVFVGCLALAGGAILYVVGELFAAGRRMSWETTLWGVFIGFVVGLATELVLVVAGA